MKKALSIMVAFALVFSMFAGLGFTKAQGATDDFNTARYGDVLDIGTYLRHLESDPEHRAELDAQIEAMAKELNLSKDGTVKITGKDKNKDVVASEDATVADSNFTYDGGTKYMLGYNNGGYYLKTYTLRSLGENVEVWVANDLSFGDGRPTPIVTQDQVDKLRDEFDNNIYPVDTGFFGMPDSHTGENATLPGMVGLPQDYYAPVDGIERVMILVDNIRDEGYYDPSYPFFIAGFFSSTVEGYLDRNVINIDTNNWEERLENTYFGTAAHEFQHLIHSDNDDMEETWINEGMSDFAEYLCGYGHPMGHVNFFLDHPENSLVEWDDHYSAETGPETLADYGQAYLLQLYLYDKYGQDFVRELAIDGDDQGFASVNKILDQYGAGIDFQELFRRFSIALAIDSFNPQAGIYEFDSIDLKVNYESAQAFEKDGVPAWGGNYKIIEETDKIRTIEFDGIDFLPTPWKVENDPLVTDNQVLWGNVGHEADNQVIVEADLSSVDTATLQFDNFIDIEEQWDFGMVQVSTDGGNTWTSLSNENTRSDVVDEGYPAIKDNLPGFTGSYENWSNETFDLTPYVGQRILINFRYMTDWGYNDSGWFIDNIQIPEIDYYNDCSSMDGFKNINEIKGDYVQYAVSFINEQTLGNGEILYTLVNVDPFDVSDEDALELRQLFKNGKNYMIIWYPAPVGTKGTVDFTYEIITKSDYVK